MTCSDQVGPGRIVQQLNRITRRSDQKRLSEPPFLTYLKVQCMVLINLLFLVQSNCESLICLLCILTLNEYASSPRFNQVP